MKTAGELLPLTRELAGRITVKRYGEAEEGGYQRNIRDQKVREILTYVAHGKPLFPIILLPDGTKGDYECLDGQHRLEAWKRKMFPLDAYVVNVGKHEKAGVFCEINSKQTRVGISHRLKVDTHADYVGFRELAKEYDTTSHLIYQLASGVKRSTHTEMNEARWDTVKKVMSAWTKDKRWIQKGGYFSRGATLKAVGGVVHHHHQPTVALKALLEMNYNYGGPLEGICNSNSLAISMMRAKMDKFILKGS